MTIQPNEVIEKEDGSKVWADTTVLGINGRGVKRPGREVGSVVNKGTTYFATSGDDVSNQLNATK